MGKIVWKSFKHNGKNFIVFFMSIILSVAVLFLLAYLGQAAGTVRGIRTQALAFAYRSELKGQIRAIIPMMILITVLVTAYSVQFYIQSRMKDYGIFWLLGISRRDMRTMIILEYALSCGIACAAGLLLGKTGTVLLGRVLGRMAGQSFAAGISLARVYIGTVLLCAVLIVGVLIAVFMAAGARGMAGVLQRDVEKEGRIDGPVSVLYFAIGAGVVSGGFFMVENEPMMAHIALFLVCAGVMACVFLGMGYMLEKFRDSAYYRRHILSWNHVYHYFKRHRSRMVIQILLGILAIYFSFLMIRGTLHERQMPNDFVCISEEEDADAFLGKMQSDFGTECRFFPFVWVNEAGGDSWIGMSEADYRRVFGGETAGFLSGKAPGNGTLADGEIYRIWRKEGSRKSMLDNSGTKRIESVTLGKCTNTEWEESGDVRGYDFQIKGERIEELLGFSLTGIVVFPDGIVEAAADKEDFHQIVMIINVDERDLSGAAAFAEDQREKGVLGEMFCRQMIAETDRKESVLNRMVAGITVGMIIVFGMFAVWLMQFSEMDEKRARYRFLCVLGMEERRAKRAAKMEILRASLVPVLLAAGIAGGFCRTFLRAYYEGEQNVAARHADERLLLVILFVYAAAEMVFILMDQAWCKWQLEKEQ